MLDEAIVPTADHVEQLEHWARAFAGFCQRYPAFLDCALSLMRRPAGELHDMVSESVWLRLGQGIARCVHHVSQLLRRRPRCRRLRRRGSGLHGATCSGPRRSARCTWRASASASSSWRRRSRALRDRPRPGGRVVRGSGARRSRRPPLMSSYDARARRGSPRTPRARSSDQGRPPGSSLLLVADAGSGKTAALEQGLEGTTAAWVRCADAAGDPGRLLALILEALRTALPGSSDVVAERLTSAREPVDPQLASRRSSASSNRCSWTARARAGRRRDAARRTGRGGAGRTAAGAAGGRAAPGDRIRHRLGLHVARARAGGWLTEIGRGLAFSAAETAAYLRLARGSSPHRRRSSASWPTHPAGRWASPWRRRAIHAATARRASWSTSTSRRRCWPRSARSCAPR